MTNEDFLLLADHVMAGPLSEVQLSYEGKVPAGVATKVETALRNHAIASLFVKPDVQPTDTAEQAKVKRDTARATNASTLQSILSA